MARRWMGRVGSSQTNRNQFSNHWPRHASLKQALKDGFQLAGARVRSGLRIVLNMRSIIFWPAILFLITPSHGKAAGKLIEFGWDEPDTAFMREHAAEMERSPFDGCVSDTETPRWWSKEGHPMKLPAVYEASVRRAQGNQTP